MIVMSHDLPTRVYMKFSFATFQVLWIADTFSEKELDTLVENHTYEAYSARANTAKILISTSVVMAKMKAVLL